MTLVSLGEDLVAALAMLVMVTAVFFPEWRRAVERAREKLREPRRDGWPIPTSRGEMFTTFDPPWWRVDRWFLYAVRDRNRVTGWVEVTDLHPVKRVTRRTRVRVMLVTKG
jgi:hypothetical protein